MTKCVLCRTADPARLAELVALGIGHAHGCPIIAARRGRHFIDCCPRCGRLIIDTDPGGMEAEDGQRWCVEHHPISTLEDHR